MFALLHDAALVQHIDAIAVHHICQTVRDEDDRLLACKAVDGGHDIVLALGIHIGSGLVKQVNGRIVQQRSCHGKALALAAG